jgi:hypothetical protein
MEVNQVDFEAKIRSKNNIKEFFALKKNLYFPGNKVHCQIDSTKHISLNDSNYYLISSIIHRGPTKNSGHYAQRTHGTLTYTLNDGECEE